MNSVNGKRILYINPGDKDEILDKQIANYLKPFCANWVDELCVVSMPFTPQHLEYCVYHAMIAPEIIREVVNGEKSKFDGCIIGCFDDPCLDAAREACDHMVVAGACESSVHMAATISNRFSVIIGQPFWEIRMRRKILEYINPERLASFRSVNLNVLDFQRDKTYTSSLIRNEISKAVKLDRAEAIILGCTLEFGFYSEMQDEFNIPVIDVSLAALKYVEFLINLRDQFGWYASKTGGWSSPRKGEIVEWGLSEKYGFSL